MGVYILKELNQVKYGLYRIIFATGCFILIFLLHFFTDFTEIGQRLQEKISDNSGPAFVEQQLYELIESVRNK